MRVAIVDYGSGNLRSAAKAFERVVAEDQLNAQILVTSKAADILAADRVVLPGVGAFGDCRAGLAALPGMIDALNQVVLEKGRPFFGICVGMQLLAQLGREHGNHQGLGWIGGEVVDLAPNDPALKVPHMGWNELKLEQPHPIVADLAQGAHAYFVHSYKFQPANPDHVVARVEYGGPVTAIIARDNVVGTQFHPEKSQATGLKVISNFLKWAP